MQNLVVLFLILSQSFVGCWGLASFEQRHRWPPKNMLLLPVCYCHTKFCYSRSNHLDISRSPSPLGWGHACPLETCYTPLYYTKFHCSKSNLLAAGRGVPKKLWRRLGGSVTDSLETHCCPTCCRTKFYHSRSNCVGVVMEKSARKFWLPCIPPSKVTQGHWNRHRSIGYLRLPISIVPIVTTVSKIKSNNSKIFTPLCI